MKRKQMQIAHVGDGKTKETAIYFLNARHGHEEEEFEGLWLQAHKVKYPKITDKKSEFYGYDGPEGNYEWFVEKEADYLRYNTTKGEIWFKFDRDELPIKEYLKYLDELGL
jgi:dolichyl-phosphate-mannose--protein O-mannosyl transferase